MSFEFTKDDVLFGICEGGVESELFEEVRNSARICYFVSRTGINDNTDCAKLTEAVLRCYSKAIGKCCDTSFFLLWTNRCILNVGKI